MKRFAGAEGRPAGAAQRRNSRTLAGAAPKEKGGGDNVVAEPPTLSVITLDHLILPVNDREASLAFYTETLGFAYAGERPPFAVVRVNEATTLQLAPWGTEDRRIYAVFNSAHKILALVFVALIVLHVAAALKHALVERDGMMRRMWP